MIDSAEEHLRSEIQLRMEEFMSPTPPQDSCLVLIIFYYMAIGTLIPWNFFINVNGYWMYKFRTVSNQTEEQELPITGAEKNALQIEFTSDLAIAAMIPNVTFLVLNGIIGHRFKMAPRYKIDPSVSSYVIISFS